MLPKKRKCHEKVASEQDLLNELTAGLDDNTMSKSNYTNGNSKSYNSFSSSSSSYSGSSSSSGSYSSSSYHSGTKQFLSKRNPTYNGEPPPITEKKDERIDFLLVGLDEEDDAKTIPYVKSSNLNDSNSNNKNNKEAAIIAGKLDFKEVTRPYNVAFYVATDISLYDIPYSVGEYDRYQMAKVIAVACLINGKQFKIYASPQLQKLNPEIKYNGWINEMADLFDQADALTCFHDAAQYGVLCKHLPFQQPMVYWRMQTFDIWTALFKTKKIRANMREIISHNNLSDTPTNALAATRDFNENNLLSLVLTLERQVSAIEKLRSMIESTPLRNIRYPVKIKGNIVRCDTVSLKEIYDKIYLKKRCNDLYLTSETKKISTKNKTDEEKK